MLFRLSFSLFFFVCVCVCVSYCLPDTRRHLSHARLGTPRPPPPPPPPPPLSGPPPPGVALPSLPAPPAASAVRVGPLPFRRLRVLLSLFFLLFSFSFLFSNFDTRRRFTSESRRRRRGRFFFLLFWPGFLRSSRRHWTDILLFVCFCCRGEISNVIESSAADSNGMYGSTLMNRTASLLINRFHHPISRYASMATNDRPRLPSFT